MKYFLLIFLLLMLDNLAWATFIFKTGQITTTTGTGSQTFDTGTSIEGKVLILWTDYTTAEGTAAEINGSSFGVGLSSSKRAAIGYGAVDNAATTDVSSEVSNVDIIAGRSGGGSPTFQADFVSFGTGGDAGKFTINVTANTLSRAALVYYVFIGGTDFTSDLVQYAAKTGATGSRDDTSATLGGDNIPDAALMFGSAGTTLNAGNNFIATFIGFVRSASKQWSVSDGARDGQTAVNFVKHRHSSSNVLTHFTFNGDALDAVAAHTAFIAGGQTLNWTDTAAEASPYFTLYFKGGAWDAGTFDALTAGGPGQSITTAVAISGAMFFSTGQATAMDTTDNEHGTMIGAGNNDGSVHESVVMMKGQNAINTDENTTNASTKSIRIIDPTGVGEADYVSQDADSIEISWSTLASAAYKIFWFGGGPSSAPISNRRRLTLVGVGS